MVTVKTSYGLAFLSNFQFLKGIADFPPLPIGPNILCYVMMTHSYAHIHLTVHQEKPSSVTTHESNQPQYPPGFESQ